MPKVEGPDCARCGHYADWHHLNNGGRFACIGSRDGNGCTCENYVGELVGADEPEKSRSLSHDGVTGGQE